jgi:branched-chain amino acid transport system permease protein
VTYVIFGGLGTLAGPVIGTIVLTIIWEGLKMAGLTFSRYIIVGILLILVIIFLPKGLVDLPEKVHRWWKDHKKPRPDKALLQE